MLGGVDLFARPRGATHRKRLVLLAWSCLVICRAVAATVNQVQQEQQLSLDEFLGLGDRALSSEPLAPDTNRPRQLERGQAELLRISSELCARFPQKCRTVGQNDPSECDSYDLEPTTGALVCVPSVTLQEAYELAAFGGEQQGRRRGNQTGALLDELGEWVSTTSWLPSLSERRSSGAPIETRALRDLRQLKTNRYKQQQEEQQKRVQRRREQHRQRQLQMDQQIVSSLPSAFAFSQLQGGARARSMRQHRSGSLVVPKRTGGAGEQLTAPATTTTSGHQLIQDPAAGDQEALQCNMRTFTYTATKVDEAGNRCSGRVAANICYGGCDTGEIADWLFPGKKSIHKVCKHGGRIRRRALLLNCTSVSGEPDAIENSLREYYYVDAHDCVCKRCTTADTTCLGTMSQPFLAQTLGEPAAASGNVATEQTLVGGD